MIGFLVQFFGWFRGVELILIKTKEFNGNGAKWLVVLQA